MAKSLSKFKAFIYYVLAESPVASLLGRMLWSPVPTWHGPFYASRNCRANTKSTLLFGLYELAERKLIQRHLPPDHDCVELGASMGVVSRCIARRLGPGRSLLMVEPAPDNFEVLQLNTKHVSFKELDVHLINRALSYASDVVHLDTSAGSLGGRVSEGDLGHSVAVESVRLDALVPEPPYSIVMDVEGAEFELMRHADLRGCCCLIVELHGDTDANQEFVRWVDSEGLRMVERKHQVWCFVR
ncbi:FkbM family methyltransferase [Haloferula sp. A504]|uniref:FkbM family methyltransferase n=1 Tax=Haloferula sp. A504 TaxID=3373601 RepID=UPI0031BF6D6B|nr:FkbM family methyltransferase [Verrucomicrobiaceae bacterium E54]